MHLKIETKPCHILILLDQIKLKTKLDITPPIQLCIANIKALCDKQYDNQYYFGNAALNRKILLDKDIAAELKPEVIHYLFTNEPTAESTLIRNQTQGGVALRDVIYYGLQEGLEVVRLMPNNDEHYGPLAYDHQQVLFAENTLKIAQSISQVAQVPFLAKDLHLDKRFLMQQYEFIINIIKKIEINNKRAELLHVPGYRQDDLQNQVVIGFNTLVKLLDIDLSRENVYSFSQQLLLDESAYLDAEVLHLFYDRAHLEVALVMDHKIRIGQHDFTFREVFQAIAWLIKTQTSLFEPSITDQFCLRFKLVESDLQKRFTREYETTRKELENHSRIEQGLFECLSKLELKSSIFPHQGAEKDFFEKGNISKAIKQFESILTEYLNSPFGFSLTNHKVRTYFKAVDEQIEVCYENQFFDKLNIDQLTANNIKLKITINEYLLATGEIKKNRWEIILSLVTKIQQVRNQQGSPFGLLVICPTLIKNIYLSNDSPLIALFATNFPIPSIEIFKGVTTPKIIQERLDEQLATLSKCIQPTGEIRGEDSFQKIQRLFRAKQFQKTRKNRILFSSQYSEMQTLPKANSECKVGVETLESGSVKEYKTAEQDTDKAIKSADEPYFPKNCSPDLALKLVCIAKEISLEDLFQQKVILPIRHKTSASGIKNIFDNGLKDRRTLTEQYDKFTPGGTSANDLPEDSKLVSFSAGKISSAISFEDEFEITMDLKQLMENPCMVFKLQDFGYVSRKIFSTSLFNFTHLDDETVNDHTKLEWFENPSNEPKSKADSDSEFDSDFLEESDYDSESEDEVHYKSHLLTKKHFKKTAVSYLPYYSLMTTNFKDLAQIIVLNFFRFLDNLKDYDSENNVITEEDSQQKAAYLKLANLTHQQLKTELLGIGRIFLRTAEFDIYRSHKIDFNKTICFKSNCHTLYIENLIQELKGGNLSVLKYHCKKMPDIWNSYRFLNYLISKHSIDPYPSKILKCLKITLSSCQSPWYLNSLYRLNSKKTKEVEEKKDVKPLIEMKFPKNCGD